LTASALAAVDVRALQVEGYADRGIGRYVASYVLALARSGRVGSALLAPELPPPSGLPGELVTAGLASWDSRAELRRLIAGDRPIVYHVTAPFLDTGPRDSAALAVAAHWAESGVPRAVTLYDLIPLRAPRHYLPSEAHEARYRSRARWVASADLILTDSEHTRTEAIDLLGCSPDRVVSVGAGVSSFFCPPDGTDQELWDHHLGALGGRPYAFTVSGSDVRKGTERLIAAMGLLAADGSDLHLVVAGHLTDYWRSRLRQAAQAAGIQDRLVMTGAISDELLRACYRRATLTVMPSLSEGAGLPVLESAACGTPALASRTTSLAEVAATPAAGFDPADTASVAEAIARLVADGHRRSAVLSAQQDLAASWTWEAVADRSASAFDQLVSRPGRVRCRELPRRLALAGPLAPAGGGIGVYGSRLLASMPPTVRVDAVTPGRGVPDLPPGVRHVPQPAMGADFRAAAYDASVYVLGNSDGHLPTVALALRHPGWLWLHEVRLPAVATTALAGLEDPEFDARFSRLLQRAYPGRAPVAAARRAGRSNLDLIAAGVGLVAPLAERCRGLLVNSEAARRLLELDLPPLAHHPPIVVLPPACPPVGPQRPAGGDGPVVALGVVSMSKRPDLLVDAAAASGCQLAFVGPCLPILAQVIGDRARQRGIADQVHVTGAVDAVAWRAWMGRAAMAVQLREAAGGETSAAVLEALAEGLPVVTNIPSALEYPAGTVSALTSPDPIEVSRRMTDLLGSPEERLALSRAGQSFAAAHQFSHLAHALLSAVMG
jgi:glycosyltransferase involved in cell wall biosynthesis